MKLRYLKNTVSLAYDPEKCAGCGRCGEVCPRGVFDIRGGKALIADRDACIECGACASNCPAGAIGVNAGVGCAAAIVSSWLTGGEPGCDCSGGDCC